MQRSINFKIDDYIPRDHRVTVPNFGECASKVEVTRAHNVHR